MLTRVLGSNTSLALLSLGQLVPSPLDMNLREPGYRLRRLEQAGAALQVADVLSKWPRAGTFTLKHMSLYQHMASGNYACIYMAFNIK